jgi:cytosine/adenosine deaminase-related metal-dependent hydrolase
MDMLEVMREATRIAHLDHSRDDWVDAFLTAPAATCGFDAPSLAPGAPADLVIVPKARSWTEFSPARKPTASCCAGCGSTGPARLRRARPVDGVTRT